MNFTQIPDNLAPVGSPLVYGFSGWEQSHPFQVGIYDVDTLALMAVKRFTGVGGGEIDISHILRRTIRFRPQTGASEIIPADNRTVRVVVTAGDAASEIRRFTACTEKPRAPSLISAMPANRLISLGESDELTLCVVGEFAVRVDALRAAQTDTMRYLGSQEGEGLALFRLDTSAMAADTERITVTAECGGGIFCRVEYTVVPRPTGAVRVAWRSTAGSVEQYTFPIVKAEVDLIAKEKFSGAEGYRDISVEVERTRTLLSAYETAATAAAVAGIAASPEVWEVSGAQYVSVDIPAQQSVLKRNGGLRYVELTIRLKSKKETL